MLVIWPQYLMLEPILFFKTSSKMHTFGWVDSVMIQQILHLHGHGVMGHLGMIKTHSFSMGNPTMQVRHNHGMKGEKGAKNNFVEMTDIKPV